MIFITIIYSLESSFACCLFIIPLCQKLLIQSYSMSLFKLQTLATKHFPQQEFDQRHMALGKIGRQPAIALANFQGWLRVFIIYKEEQLSMNNVYENKFQSGIIEVKFVTHPDQKIKQSAIGVLFFRRFTYIHFQAGSQNKFSAKLMNIDVEPAFGIGVSPICLFTLNSTIQYLNPIETLKIKVADPIYPYTRNLQKIYFVDGQQLVEIEGSTEQWRIIVGRIRQLFVFIETIIVIGERALWQICEAKIVKTKVMQEDISCGAIAFRNLNAYNILVANFNRQLFVYSSNYELLWAIKLDYVPIKIVVCEHEEIKGLLAILSDQGTLELAYSGVEVPDSVVQPLSQKIEYALVEAQTQQYLQRLKGKGGDKQQKKAQKLSEGKQGYKAYFGGMQKSYQSLQQKERLYQIDGKIITHKLFIEITSRQALRDVKVQINLPFNLYSPEINKELVVAKYGDKIIFNIYASNESFPYQKQITLIVRYQNDSQAPPFINMQNIPIPMSLQCAVAGFQSKETFENKIIIKSNLEMASFNDLFAELVGASAGEQKKAIRFVLSNGIECVITYNKGFNKAKIESPEYSGLCYIVSQFANHIRLLNIKLNSKIELSVQIPLEQFFSVMKQHYEYRQKLKLAFEEVQLKSEQFKNSEKKLLMRMKQKMSNLGNIDKLLEYTFQRLVQSTNRYQQIQRELDIINHNLCVAIRLIIQLLFIRSNPSDKAKKIANGILGYERESLTYGWQQKLYANSCYYLNKKWSRKDNISLEQLQKIPLFVISKVNNGDWN